MGLNVVQITDFPGVSQSCKEAFKFAEIEYHERFCEKEEEVIAKANNADVIIMVPSIPSIPRKIIEALPLCRYILGLVSGYDGLDLEAATEQGILVTNMADLFWEEVSDHTMALILACSRKIVELNQAVKRGEWIRNRKDSRIARVIDPKIDRLHGKTLGLIGFGGIGRTVALKARAFGMKIIANDPYVASGLFTMFNVEAVGLDRLLEESDFVSIHAFLSEENRNLLGLGQFKKMKPTAYIINAARGPIINQEALYTALTEELIAGAALDAIDPEPCAPENNPLLALENVIVTAHRAGRGKKAFSNVAKIVPKQVFKVARGEWPNNIINPAVKDKYLNKWMK